MSMAVQSGIGVSLSSTVISIRESRWSESENSSSSSDSFVSAEGSASYVREDSPLLPVTANQAGKLMSLPCFLVGISLLGILGATLLYLGSFPQENGKDESAGEHRVLTNYAVVLLMIFMPLLSISSVWLADSEN